MAEHPTRSEVTHLRPPGGVPNGPQIHHCTQQQSCWLVEHFIDQYSLCTYQYYCIGQCNGYVLTDEEVLTDPMEQGNLRGFIAASHLTAFGLSLNIYADILRLSSLSARCRKPGQVHFTTLSQVVSRPFDKSSLMKMRVSRLADR